MFTLDNISVQAAGVAEMYLISAYNFKRMIVLVIPNRNHEFVEL